MSLVVVIAFLVTVWVALAIWVRRTVMWVILAGFLVIGVLFIASGILQSAAGPAADWFHGTTPEDRAHGRGTMSDLSSLFFLIGFLAFPAWVLFTLGAVAYLVLDSVRQRWV